jgi:DNA-binding transcriptional LysR family regulator
MSVQYLRYFIEIYRSGSIYQAAKNLFVTPQGISQGLKRLEETLGAPLFLRKQNVLVPTDFGKAFYPRAVIALRSMDDLELFAKNFLLSGENSIRVGLLGYNRFSYLILSLIESFQKENADVRINTTFYEQSQYNVLTMNALSGELDVAWCFHTQFDPAFSYLTIKNKPLKCLISPDNPLSKKPSLNWADLKDEPFISTGKDEIFPLLIRRHCQQCGFVPNEKFFSIDSAFVSQLVAKNQAIALYYDDYINGNRHLFQNAAVKDIYPELYVCMSLFIRKENEHRQLMKAFLSYLKSGLNKNPGIW